jgi:hypothetical protein
MHPYSEDAHFELETFKTESARALKSRCTKPPKKPETETSKKCRSDICRRRSSQKQQQESTVV